VAARSETCSEEGDSPAVEPPRGWTMSKKVPRLLLAEGDPSLRALDELILREAGYEVENLPPGEDLIAYAARTQPDALIVDVGPPAPGFWDVIDRLNANPSTDTIPVVVITTAERAAIEARAAPVVREAVIMPYDIDALRHAVARALGSPPPAALLPEIHRAAPPAVAFAADALTGNSRQIVLRTIARLQRDEPFRSRFAELFGSLLDHLPVISGAIVAALRRGLTPEEVRAVPGLRNAVREHIRERIGRGLRPGDILREYQTLEDQMRAVLRDQVGHARFSAMDAVDVDRAIDAFFGELLRVAVDDYADELRQRCPAPLPPSAAPARVTPAGGPPGR
jgi:CheY-like chemotaxis protein